MGRERRITIDPLNEDPHQDSDAQAIAAAIARSVAQAERGETLSVAEAKAHSLELLYRTATERVVAAERAKTE